LKNSGKANANADIKTLNSSLRGNDSGTVGIHMRNTNCWEHHPEQSTERKDGPFTKRGIPKLPTLGIKRHQAMILGKRKCDGPHMYVLIIMITALAYY
jgi:hypothetical protein